jgi:hypothetical protein
MALRYYFSMFIEAQFQLNKISERRGIVTFMIWETNLNHQGFLIVYLYHIFFGFFSHKRKKVLC